MRKTRIVGLNAYLRLVKKDLTKYWADEQTDRLVEYAQETIVKIGDRILSSPSRNNLDRTGQLLNSLCWGVSYKGNLVKGGFFRDAVTRNKGIDGSSTSYLHEWFSGDEKYLIPVDGRRLAQEYLESYGNNGARGWKVFFAILVPYWGYWEKGFLLKTSPQGKDGGHRFVQFAVMTQFYDQIKNDLKPARTRFRVSVAKYSHAKLKEKWSKIAGI